MFILQKVRQWLVHNIRRLVGFYQVRDSIFSLKKHIGLFENISVQDDLSMKENNKNENPESPSDVLFSKSVAEIPTKYFPDELLPAVRMLDRATDESCFFVKLNGVDVLLPKHTLLTMRHCMTFDVEGGIVCLVEHEHSKILWQRLGGNGFFLDIGAADGTMSVPFAVLSRDFPGEALHIFAFEPSHTARSTLLRALSINDIEKRVTVIDKAVSNYCGVVVFNEVFGSAKQDEVPFLPETSGLSKRSNIDVFLHSQKHQIQYFVDVVTIDSIAHTLGIPAGANVVVKIDIEGFEHLALEGMWHFITEHRPFIVIDIHLMPDFLGNGEYGSRDTESACRDFLSKHGYRCKKEKNHYVMYCFPN